MPAKDRSKYGHKHDQASRALRAAWYANPNTRCVFCALTYAEGVEVYGETRAAWEADHPQGRTDLPLRPAHRTCNRADGADRGNRMRMPRTETW